MDKLIIDINDIGCQTVKPISLVVVHLQYDLLIALLKHCNHSLDYFKLLFALKSSNISPSLNTLLEHEISEYNNIVPDKSSEFVAYDGFKCGCIDIWISYVLFRDLVIVAPVNYKDTILEIVKKSSISEELKNYFLDMLDNH